MPIKPKSFFTARFADSDKLFCTDEDGLLWVLTNVQKRYKGGYVTPVPPADWYWRRVSLQTENEAKPEGAKEKDKPPYR